MNNWYVYRHIRLDKNEPFYIGIGKTANFHRAYDFCHRRSFWKNIKAKTKIEVDILFTDLTLEEAKNKEIEFITLYGRKNLGTGSLVNLTNGGDQTYEVFLTQEQRTKISERNKGYKHTPEAKEKIALAAKSISQETRDKMSNSRKGKPRSPETIEKMRIAGTNISDETRAKRSVSIKLAKAKIKEARPGYIIQ